VTSQKKKLFMVQQNNLRAEYLTNGFIVIKSLFTKDHIANLREKMIGLSKKGNDDYEFLLDKEVQDLILNEKLISTIKEILDANKLLYFTDCGVVNHKEPFKNKNGYHNDARGEDQTLPYEQEYPILRVGIYFENYKDFSGGLKIKKKSHKYFIFNFRRILADIRRVMRICFTKTRYNFSSLRLGKSVNLELEQGDIVIWNLRTHHCGTSRRLKLFPKLCLQPFFEKLLPTNFFLPTQYKEDRCAIFSTFADKDLKNNNILGYINKKINLNRLSQIKTNSSLLSKLAKLDCELPDTF
tara:strand:+ start:1890 stop:2780 length:891 start_codon:yes stop_codon:yes gene_type:complete